MFGLDEERLAELVEAAGLDPLIEDLELGAGNQIDAIENGVGDLFGGGRRVIAIGGDHAITFPIVRAASARFPQLTILHLDAHPDLYDELGGNRFSHACPLARIMESGLARRLVQIGVRTANPHQRAQAERFGVETHGSRNPPRIADLGLEPPLYLSIDLDVLDPAYAPGVSHPEPGGLTTRQVIDLIQDLPAAPVAADIVELNPARDINGLTARVAAKLLKEVLSTMLG